MAIVHDLEEPCCCLKKIEAVFFIVRLIHINLSIEQSKTCKEKIKARKATK